MQNKPVVERTALMKKKPRTKCCKYVLSLLIDTPNRNLRNLTAGNPTCGLGSPKVDLSTNRLTSQTLKAIITWAIDHNVNHELKAGGFTS